MSIKIFRRALAAVQEGKTGVLVTITDSSEGELQGTKIWWQETEKTRSGAITFSSPLKKWQEQLHVLCEECWKEKQPKLQRFSAGGETFIEFFAQPVLPGPALIIFGAGHISTVLASIAQTINFQVTVVDDRADFASPSRFPGARVLCLNFADAFQEITVHSNTYIAIITRGHKYDALCLEEALQTPACYIGMIGSRRKVQMVKEHILEAGYTDEHWKRVYSPVGLPIGAQTPAEIAVSILAEIIAVKYGIRRMLEVRQGGC